MSEWISIKDRMPEDERFVLVYSAKRPMAIAWFSHTCKMWMNLSYCISHWMHLPPKPGDKDG